MTERQGTTSRLRRAVIVTRKSQLTQLIERRGTFAQAEFYLRSRGGAIAPLVTAHERIEQALRDVLSDWGLAPVVQALQALRGVQLIAAMTLVAELQDFLRFESPRQLMAYVGLVPSEHSSGPKRRQGSIYPRPATAPRGACWSRWPGTTSTAHA